MYLDRPAVMPVKRTKVMSNGQLENRIKKALILSGQLVAQRATQKAPILTGRLKRSITSGQPFLIGAKTWAVLVGTNVEYAKYQEFGTLSRSELPELSVDPSRPGGVPPSPYLRPALRESVEDIKAIIARSVEGK